MAKHIVTSRDVGTTPDGPEPKPSPAAVFGAQLKRFRESKNLTQAQLASTLGWSQQELSQLERTGEISLPQLSQLKGVGLDVDKFLDPSSGTVEGIDPVVHALRLVTNLYEGGLVEIYPTRAEALQRLKPYLQKEDVQVDITGSSLKGLVMNRDIMGTIAERLKNTNVQVRILLTHPAFACLRAFVEGRKSVSLQNEIREAMDTYSKNYLQTPGQDRTAIRVTLHPPSIFAIFLKRQGIALVNPYTLTTEAYSTSSLIIRDTGRETCMFRQYQLHHFDKAWARKEGERKVTIQSILDDTPESKRLYEVSDELEKAMEKISQAEMNGE